MGKESAMGHDPLGWIKAAKENKKLSPDTVTDKNPGENSQKTDIQPALKQQPPIPPNIDKPRDNAQVTQLPEKSGTTTNKVEPTKPKVVIGRMYERPPPEKTKAAQVNESTSQGTRQSIKPSFPVTTPSQQIKRMEPEINLPITTSGDRFLMYIIVAYTACLLILGYFVYSDLSKRMSRIESKFFTLQKELHKATQPQPNPH